MRRAFLICAFLGLLPLLGCNSLERLYRNSPVGSKPEPGDRVNLWPLAYKAGDRLAVLWPLYDQDRQGFALRPLVTRVSRGEGFSGEEPGAVSLA